MEIASDAVVPVRIGVDVGGTNTDAVAVQGKTILGSAKCCTTPDVFSGIRAAMIAALDGAGIAGESE